MSTSRCVSSRVLDVVDVHTYYGESHVLHGVTLTVADGEVLTILGRNGMGKTTLIRSIIGFTPPRVGTVRLKGQDVAGFPPYRLVEQNLPLALGVADRVHILSRGQIVYTGAPAALTADEEVKSRYLGVA